MSICIPTHEHVGATNPASAAPRIDRQYWSAVLFVTSLSLGLGLFRLNMPTIWYDEAATWLNVSDDWRWLWLTTISGEDCGGFVYAVLIKFWTSIFGYGEFALRAPGVLFSVGMVWVLLQIGCTLGSLRTGVYMALFGALHPVVICWSRQARAYSLEMLLTAAYLLVLLNYGRSGGRMRAVALTLVGSLLALTHIFGLFVVVGGTLFLLALRFYRSIADGDGPVRRSMIPTMVTCVLFGIWVFMMQGRVKRNLDYFWITGSITEKYLEVLYALIPMFAVTIFLVIAGFGLLIHRRRLPAERRLVLAVGLILIMILGCPLAVSAFSRGAHHFILPRYFLPGVVPIVVILGYLFAALPQRFAGPCALVLCGAMLMATDIQKYYFDAAPNGGRTRAVVSYLSEHVRKGDQIFITPEFEKVTLHYYGVPFDSVRGAGLYDQREKLHDLLQTTPPPQAGARRWVLAYYTEPGDDLRDLGLQDCRQERFGMIQLARVEAEAKPNPATSSNAE